MRTKLKNKVHSITLMKGIDASDVDRTSTFTKRDMDKLEGHDDYRINGCLRVIRSLNDEVSTVSKKILLLAKEDEIAKLLMTIPDITLRSSSNDEPVSRNILLYDG